MVAFQKAGTAFEQNSDGQGDIVKTMSSEKGLGTTDRGWYLLELLGIGDTEALTLR